MHRTIAVSVLTVAALIGASRPAAAQPYAWVPLEEFLGGPFKNVLRVVNVATTHVQSVDLPAGIRMGKGDIDPLTGHYFLITDFGTGEFAPDPPRLLPGLKSWRGSALYFSPDGVYAYVCSQAGGNRCELILRANDQVLAVHEHTHGIQFDEFGGHVVIAGAQPSFSVTYHSPASPTIPVWTRSYDAALSRVAVAGNRVFVLIGSTLDALDSETGALVHSTTTVRPTSRIAAAGGRVFGVSVDGLVGFAIVRITSYSADTLSVLAESVLGGPVMAPSVSAIHPTSDGQTLVVETRAQPGASLRLLTADTLERIAGGGFPGQTLNHFTLSLSDHALCRVAVTPPTVTLPAAGGTVAYTVSPETGCGIWPVSARGEGFALLGPIEHVGPAQVVLEVGQNQSATFPLHHTALVAGHTVAVEVAQLTDVPLAPRAVTVQRSGPLTTISWEPAPTGPIPSSFVIEGGLAGGPVLARFTAAKTARSLPVPGLMPGDYFVQVRAVNAVGEGAASAAVGFSVAASASPDAPEGLVADVQASVVRLQWTAASGGAAAERFVIEAAQAGGAFVPIGSTSAGATGFAIVAPPALFGSYMVRVRAVNAAGSSAPSAEVSVSPGTCTGPPQAPASLDAVVTGSLVTLAWPAPAGGAEQFVIDVGSRPGSADIASVVTAGPQLTMRTTAPVSHYFVQVRGRNSCGTGQPSATRVVFVLWESPS